MPRNRTKKAYCVSQIDYKEFLKSFKTTLIIFILLLFCLPIYSKKINNIVDNEIFFILNLYKTQETFGFLTLGNVYEVEETFSSIVTAYNTIYDQCDGSPCISANMENICGKKNTIACPRRYQFNALFLIDNEIYRCNDRKNIKYDNSFDINFDKDVVGAKEYGSKYHTVRKVKIML